MGIDAVCQNTWHLMKNSDASKISNTSNFKEQLSRRIAALSGSLQRKKVVMLLWEIECPQK
jgi:hypothetical protein